MRTPALLAAHLAFFVVCFAFGCPPSAHAADSESPAPSSVDTKVPLTFTGGHETEGVDRGRPVILIAAALNVPPAVFREAFTHVTPAGPGQHPEPVQVRLNKQALMQHLAPYGVTDDRLNEVSNYYRYHRESGELWRHVDAAGFALVRGGKIVQITITEPGAGYSSPPMVSLPVGLTVYPLAIVSYGTNLATNGSISKIEQTPIGDNNPHASFVIPQKESEDIPLKIVPPSSH